MRLPGTAETVVLHVSGPMAKADDEWGCLFFQGDYFLSLFGSECIE